MGKLKNLCLTQLLKVTVREKPDPNVWVFSSDANAHFNYNARYLFEYVKENLPEITPLFVINDAAFREKLAREYGAQYFVETQTPRGIRRVLRAGVWCTSAGLPVYGTHLKKNRLIVNLWHGIPLKKIALQDGNLNIFSRLFFREIFSKNYSFILTTSSKLVPVMEKSFAVDSSVVRVWGQPRNDMLFEQVDRDAVWKKIYGTLPEYRRAVLYAPTFRDQGSTRLFPFPDFDRKKLEDFLEKEKTILFLRTHLSEKCGAGEYLSGRIRFLGSEEAEDITGMLTAFDGLITDYSSIYIDFLLTGRPMIFLPYDQEEYLKNRGMNFVYDEVTPGPKPKTQEAFLKDLKEMLEGGDAYREKRDAANDFFNEVRQPCCGEICRHIRECMGMEMQGSVSKV